MKNVTVVVGKDEDIVTYYVLKYLLRKISSCLLDILDEVTTSGGIIQLPGVSALVFEELFQFIYHRKTFEKATVDYYENLDDQKTLDTLCQVCTLAYH